jgi:deazaflavin-dependent oxidoreductase (nitroreductase family)
MCPKTASQYLYLTTKGWKSGKEHQIEIWFVEHDGKYYIMSEKQEHSHWVQNIIHNPNVSITLGQDTIEATARIVYNEKEPQLADDITKLMSAKTIMGLIIELKPF